MAEWVIKIKWKQKPNGTTIEIKEIPIQGSTSSKDVDRIVTDWRGKNSDKDIQSYRAEPKES